MNTTRFALAGFFALAVFSQPLSAAPETAPATGQQDQSATAQKD